MLGKYKMVNKIGEGMFGSVHLVEDPQGSRFALKSLKINPMEPERAQE